MSSSSTALLYTAQAIRLFRLTPELLEFSTSLQAVCAHSFGLKVYLSRSHCWQPNGDVPLAASRSPSDA